MQNNQHDIATLIPAGLGQQTARADRATMLKNRFYPESVYGGYTDIDGTVVFHSRVNALVNLDHVVIDVGCGRGGHLSDAVDLRRNLKVLKGKCRRVIGIDVDSDAADNPYLDEFRLIPPSMEFPLPGDIADVCVTDYVVEHVQDPIKFFSECYRVLKPGGFLCIRTTNLHSYIGLAATLTPNRMHARVVGWAQRERQSKDVFPTQYRANTRRKLSNMLRKAGFDASVYTHNPEPSYLSRSAIAYRLGVFYQRHAPRAWGAVLLAFARKKTKIP